MIKIPTDVFSESTPFIAFHICTQSITSTCVYSEKGKVLDIGGFAINNHL